VISRDSQTPVRPQRWDQPFGSECISSVELDRLLALPELAAIESHRFPPDLPLREILANDARLVRCRPGELIVREGDYGHSAFLVIGGSVRVVLPPGLPRAALGRRESSGTNWWNSIRQIWRSHRVAELRGSNATDSQAQTSSPEQHVVLQDVPAVINRHKTSRLARGALFGELAALGRLPRTATMFAEEDCELLEIRWQGLREIRRFDPGWRRMIDERYRANALRAHLGASPLLASLDEPTLDVFTRETLFESYGTFDWHVSYRRLQEAQAPVEEPLIAREGDHPDGLLLIRAGFARVSRRTGQGRRTLTYLGAGDHFGIEELQRAAQPGGGDGARLETTLSAVGYVDVLRVPSKLVEEHLLPRLGRLENRFQTALQRPIARDATLEWLVDRRFINATQAMVIDLDRCTRCDDCLRACASTHDGNPRFRRAGPVQDHWQVAHACMHCVDPVCLIGCPTGAIHRTMDEGVVVINDQTCVGCGTCAQSCPYDNIVMVTARRADGNLMTDPADGKPILKATKCDLCEEHPGGPACVRACPHDALTRVEFRHVPEFGVGPAGKVARQ